MADIGHNNPPLDPKETIQSNINRKKPHNKKFKE